MKFNVVLSCLSTLNESNSKLCHENCYICNYSSLHYVIPSLILASNTLTKKTYSIKVVLQCQAAPEKHPHKFTGTVKQMLSRTLYLFLSRKSEANHKSLQDGERSLCP